MILNRAVPRALALRRTLQSTRCEATRSHLGLRFINSPSVQRVREVQGPIATKELNQHVWHPNKPLVIRNAHSLPAMKKWFSGDEDATTTPFTEYFLDFEWAMVPYEFTSQPSQSQTWASFIEWSGHGEFKDIVQPLLSPEDGASQFHQFYLPLALMQLASGYNHSKLGQEQLTHLYIAQCDIGELPEKLAQDLEAPDIVRSSPKGDIYSSSIWVGLQPTYTPLHTDPNPNIFCQLYGHKTVRFVPPKVGLSIFSRIKQRLGMQGNPQLRGTEMMEGPERDLLHEAVWSAESKTDQLQEATVGPGDVLFIPKGWWHSFMSQGQAGVVNASANWWCR